MGNEEMKVTRGEWRQRVIPEKRETEFLCERCKKVLVAFSADTPSGFAHTIATMRIREHVCSSNPNLTVEEGRS